jgi:hypothetical protein
MKDWYLSTINELNLIYENLQKAEVMNLGTDTYWFSSQSSDNYAWVLKMRK